MQASAQDDGWGFQHVIDLIQSFNLNECAKASDTSHHDTSGSSSAPEPSPIAELGKPNQHSLGDFDSIWSFLNGNSDGETLDAREKGTKEVRWRDDIDGAELADDDEKEDDAWLAGLTKQQRKKARRRYRKAQGLKVPASSENESEVESDRAKSSKRRSIIQDILDRPLPKTNGSDAPSRTRSLSFDDRWPVAKPRANGKRPADPAESLALATAKYAKLLDMLSIYFLEEKDLIDSLKKGGNADAALMLNGGHSSHPHGIHIFVDASNIMIGFHDALKVAHSLPLTTRLRRQPFSFHIFSLILSRGRPIAKRVVVGSDNYAEMVEAKAMGYETNVLDRVHKAKELTPKQRKYALAGSTNGNGIQSAGSGSETPGAAAVARAKWVEQAVDEILHLKMMESIVDAAEPSTMVLATGDAAEAEYSAGFLKMVERALSKGWKVELACWSLNMSSAYKRKDFRQKWAGSFRIIELDAFVDVLLRTEGIDGL